MLRASLVNYLELSKADCSIVDVQLTKEPS